MTARQIVFYRCYQNTLVSQLLIDSLLFPVLKTMFRVSKTSELKYGYPFSKERAEDIGVDLQASSFLLVWLPVHGSFSWQWLFFDVLHVVVLWNYDMVLAYWITFYWWESFVGPCHTGRSAGSSRWKRALGGRLKVYVQYKHHYHFVHQNAHSLSASL